MVERARIEKEVADHPGEIEIWGVKLDLSVQEDAALAAKWLDLECASLALLAIKRLNQQRETCE